MNNLEGLQHFGWCKPDWCLPSSSKETNELLRQCTQLPTQEPSDDVEELIRKQFPIPFPIQTVRLEKLKERKSPEELQRNISSTYPLIHERVLLLMTHFLIYKREFGNSIEKDFYKDMTVPQFIDRILLKRAAAFVGPDDEYKLLSGEEGEDNWESVGSLSQKAPLILDDCLSYDELKIAAMVFISSWTVTINNGTRTNSGMVREKDIEKEAIIIGTIGPRFQRVSRMDFEDILIIDYQNISENGYGHGEGIIVTCLNAMKPAHLRNNQLAKQMWRQMWADFYEVPNYRYVEVSSLTNRLQGSSDESRYTDRLIQISGATIFDNEAYYKRIVIIAETVLLEAERRASEAGREAFVNVIGCGLGVWRISTHQNDVYVLTFVERTRALLRHDALHHVTDVNFSYVPISNALRDSLKNTTEANREIDRLQLFLEYDKHPKGGIFIHFVTREPSSKLTGEHAGKLLVMIYPWDSNAHPGNEFWFGTLNTSGDPACASSTQVTELHNAHINPRVSSTHTRVATISSPTPRIDTLTNYSKETSKFGTLNTSGDPACASSTQVTELHNAHINPRVSSTHTRVATISSPTPHIDTLTNYSKETSKFGTLNTSGDPACASSTQVTELHNAHINPRVSSTHTRVATISSPTPHIDTLTNYSKETSK